MFHTCARSEGEPGSGVFEYQSCSAVAAGLKLEGFEKSERDVWGVFGPLLMMKMHSWGFCSLPGPSKVSCLRLFLYSRHHHNWKAISHGGKKKKKKKPAPPGELGTHLYPWRLTLEGEGGL